MSLDCVNQRIPLRRRGSADGDAALWPWQDTGVSTRQRWIHRHSPSTCFPGMHGLPQQTKTLFIDACEAPDRQLPLAESPTISKFFLYAAVTFHIPSNSLPTRTSLSSSSSIGKIPLQSSRLMGRTLRYLCSRLRTMNDCLSSDGKRKRKGEGTAGCGARALIQLELQHT
jgi:hypothetical protein